MALEQLNNWVQKYLQPASHCCKCICVFF